MRDAAISSSTQLTPEGMDTVRREAHVNNNQSTTESNKRALYTKSHLPLNFINRI